jgi:hypothetical protein
VLRGSGSDRHVGGRGVVGVVGVLGVVLRVVLGVARVGRGELGLAGRDAVRR